MRQYHLHHTFTNYSTGTVIYFHYESKIVTPLEENFRIFFIKLNNNTCGFLSMKKYHKTYIRMLTSAILITVKHETTQIYVDRKIDNQIVSYP